MIRKNYHRYKQWIESRNKLDGFLIKGALLACAYFLLRILLKNTPLLKPVFVLGKKALTGILVYGSNTLIKLFFGYDSKVHENIVYIEGSEGVKITNACLGWSMMALFAGFIIAYPGVKKSKYYMIPLGLIIIILFNMLRITLMVIISYKAYDSLQFYHRYIFNFILYLVVFSLWFFWARRFRV